MEFSSKLNSSRSSPNDTEIKKVASVNVGKCGLRSFLKAWEDIISMGLDREIRCQIE